MFVATEVVAEAGSLSHKASAWKSRIGVSGSSNWGKTQGMVYNSDTVTVNVWHQPHSGHQQRFLSIYSALYRMECSCPQGAHSPERESRCLSCKTLIMKAFSKGWQDFREKSRKRLHVACRGIQLAVDWFLDKGHKDITVFVPAWRKEQSRPDAPITGTNSIKTFLLIQKQSWQDSLVRAQCS